MKSKTSRAVAAAMALVLVVSAAGVAFAAAPSTDTETTDTTYVSDLQGGDTITYNESTDRIHTFSADSANGSVVIYQDGRLLAEYTNDSDLVTNPDTVSGTYYYNATLAADGSDFPGIVAGPGETVSLTIERVNDSTLDSPDTSNVTVSFANDANLTFDRVGADETETSEASIFARTLSTVNVFSEENITTPATAEQSVTVTGQDQDKVIIAVADADAQDALSTSIDGVEGLSGNGYAMVDGQLVPIVSSASDAPDWIDSDEAYVTVSSDGTQATVWNAGDVLDSGQETADVSLNGAQDVSIFQAFSVARDYGASITEVATAMASTAG